MTLMAVVIASAALVLAPFLYRRLNEVVASNQEGVAANHALTCSLGDLVQLGSGRIEDATIGPTRHLRAEKDFLLAIYNAHCPLIADYPAVERRIVETLSAVRVELQRRAGP